MPTWALVFTSAAIGAITSAMVTMVGQLLGQALDRRARRRELLFSKAIDLARWKNERTLEVAQRKGSGPYQIDDEVFLARVFLEDLETLFATGKLPAVSERYYEREVRPSRER